MNLIISIDPGRSKCGLLLADIRSRAVIKAGTVQIDSLFNLLLLWNKVYIIDKIIIGNGTNSDYIVKKLSKKNINNLFLINEKGSTLRARFRYWEIWPPNYFFRLLPKEILFPPQNLDPVVALILLEEFLNHKLNWPKEVKLTVWP